VGVVFVPKLLIYMGFVVTQNFHNLNKSLISSALVKGMHPSLLMRGTIEVIVVIDKQGVPPALARKV